VDPSAFVASQELIDALVTLSVPVPCEEDCILFCQGYAPAGVYVVSGGAVKLAMVSVSGKLMFEVESGPGSVLGLPGVIANQAYSLTAVARQGSKIGFVTREKFTELMGCNPALSMRVLEVLAAEVRTARRAIFEP